MGRGGSVWNRRFSPMPVDPHLYLMQEIRAEHRDVMLNPANTGWLTPSALMASSSARVAGARRATGDAEDVSKKYDSAACM